LSSEGLERDEVNFNVLIGSNEFEDPRNGPPLKEPSPRLPTQLGSTLGKEETFGRQTPQQISVLLHHKIRALNDMRDIPIHERLYL